MIPFLSGIEIFGFKVCIMVLKDGASTIAKDKYCSVTQYTKSSFHCFSYFSVQVEEGLKISVMNLCLPGAPGSLQQCPEIVFSRPSVES
jgi:hypothetical protein